MHATMCIEKFTFYWWNRAKTLIFGQAIGQLFHFSWFCFYHPFYLSFLQHLQMNWNQENLNFLNRIHLQWEKKKFSQIRAYFGFVATFKTAIKTTAKSNNIIIIIKPTVWHVNHMICILKFEINNALDRNTGSASDNAQTHHFVSNYFSMFEKPPLPSL